MWVEQHFTHPMLRDADLHQVKAEHDLYEACRMRFGAEFHCCFVAL